MKRNILLIIVAVLLVIAALTNPSELAHQGAVKIKLAEYMQQQKGATTGLGAMFAAAMIQRMVDSIVSRDNYIFFSLTEMKWRGESKTVGLGIFGHVYAFGKLNDLANSAPQ